MDKEQILGFNVNTYTSEKLLNRVFMDYSRDEQLFIVSINPEIVVSNYKNKNLKKILNEQKYQIPDGSGIVWASKRKKGNIRKRITGIDLMLDICKESQNYSSNIFLYGATDDVVQKAKKELEKVYPEIRIIGTNNGYEDEEKVIQKLKTMPIDILFVGLGSPKQENFIIKYKDELKNIKILMPVGGSFDVISKTKKRAPNWMIKCNLEWLYRLLQEPKRIFRQMKLIKFIFLVLSNRN